MVSLYAYRYFNPQSNSRFGGAELQLYYFATELAKDPNYDVNFIVGDFDQPAREKIQNVNLYKFFNPRSPVRFTSIIIGLYRLIRLLLKIDADIYIQRSAGMESGVASLFCALFRKKFIYMAAHDEDLLPQRPTWIPPGFLYTLRWRMFKFGLRTAKLVVVQHEKQLENLKKYTGKTGVIRLSAHPIPDSLPTMDRKYILWVARGDDWKRPEIYLDLAKQFPNESFYMAMPDANNEAYHKKIQQLAGQIPNLKFLDTVPFNEIDNYFKSAKVFVNTSRAEGFPNTFVQAAKFGTPILSMNVDPNNMLSVHDGGILANKSPDQLKVGLESLLSNNDLWAKTSANAYRYAKQYHDLAEIIKTDKELLQTI